MQRRLGQREPRADVALAQRCDAETLVLQPLGPIQRTGERRPLPVRPHGQADQAIGGLVDQVGEARRLLGQIVTNEGLAPMSDPHEPGRIRVPTLL